jgi:hypothetical protein
MNIKMWQKGLLLFILFSPALLFSQTERWIYAIYGDGVAYSVTYGTDGNIYTVGSSPGVSDDFTVVSLTSSGAERWIYKFNLNGDDIGHSIVSGADGNIYASGYSEDTSGYFYLTIVSLDTAGNERWIYQYRESGTAVEPSARSKIVFGSDGNIYATGYSTNVGFIVSLTTGGTENWVYQCSPAMFYSLVFGSDNNLYGVGFISEPPSYQRDFMVVSVTNSGTEKWLYRYNSGGDGDMGKSIVYGGDNNIYAAGRTGSSGAIDFCALSVDTSGNQRWIYPLHQGSEDVAYSLVYGSDGDIYVGGTVGDPLTMEWTILSFSSSGDTNWSYTYDGPAGEDDWSNSVTYGYDGNIYTTGWSESSSWSPDLTVISTDISGNENWVYRGPKGWGWSVVQGSEGNIYVGGDGWYSETGKGFTVVSIAPTQNIKEREEIAAKKRNGLAKIYPNPFSKSVIIEYQLSVTSSVSLKIYNRTGQLIKTLVNEKQGFGNHQVTWNANNNTGEKVPNGVYFCKLECRGFTTSKKVLFIK